MRIVISNAQIAEILGADAAEFPKYTTQLLNLANQNAGGTRPAIVGQLSEMIQEFPGKTVDEWREYYFSQKPGAMDDAVSRIWAMVQQLAAALEQIDESMVRAWVHDLVITKTFAGLRFQAAILSAVATERGEEWQLAAAADEAKGIDGYIGGEPVSVKPRSYQAKPALGESLPVRILYYEKKRNGLVVTWDSW